MLCPGDWGDWDLEYRGEDHDLCVGKVASVVSGWSRWMQRSGRCDVGGWWGAGVVMTLQNRDSKYGTSN